MPILDSFGSIDKPETVRPEVKHATLLMVGLFYRYRDGNPEDFPDADRMPRPVQALLIPLRDPTMQ